MGDIRKKALAAEVIVTRGRGNTTTIYSNNNDPMKFETTDEIGMSDYPLGCLSSCLDCQSIAAFGKEKKGLVPCFRMKRQILDDLIAQRND